MPCCFHDQESIQDAQNLRTGQVCRHCCLPAGTLRLIFLHAYIQVHFADNFPFQTLPLTILNIAVKPAQAACPLALPNLSGIIRWVAARVGCTCMMKPQYHSQDAVPASKRGSPISTALITLNRLKAGDCSISPTASCSEAASRTPLTSILSASEGWS